MPSEPYVSVYALYDADKGHPNAANNPISEAVVKSATRSTVKPAASPQARRSSHCHGGVDWAATEAAGPDLDQSPPDF